MANELLLLGPALAAGMLLGGIFFGGLWWTVRLALSSQWAALWFFGSLQLRMGIAMAGFYLIGQGQWQHWLSCLVGFALARLAVNTLTRPRTPSAAEAGLAP